MADIKSTWQNTLHLAGVDARARMVIVTCIWNLLLLIQRPCSKRKEMTKRVLAIAVCSAGRVGSSPSASYCLHFNQPSTT